VTTRKEVRMELKDTIVVGWIMDDRIKDQCFFMLEAEADYLNIEDSTTCHDSYTLPVQRTSSRKKVCLRTRSELDCHAFQDFHETGRRVTLTGICAGQDRRR
jgi:hypothetical protein